MYIDVCIVQFWGSSILLIISKMSLHLHWGPSVVNVSVWTWFGQTHTCLHEVSQFIMYISGKNKPSDQLNQCTYSGFKTISASLVDPRSLEAPAILKWKKSGTTRTLSSSRSGKKYWACDHEPNGHPGWAPEALWAESQLSAQHLHPPIIGFLSVPLKILDVKINSRVLPSYKIFSQN